MKIKIHTILFAVLLIAVSGVSFSNPPAGNSESPKTYPWKKLNELYNASDRFVPYMDSVIRSYNFCNTTDTTGVYEPNVTQMQIDRFVVPVDGEDALAKFMAENMKYPQMAMQYGIEGKVELKFIINEKGEICNVRVLNQGGIGFAEEAIRVLSLTKNKWLPAISKDQKIKSYRVLPVSFKLAKE